VVLRMWKYAPVPKKSMWTGFAVPASAGSPLACGSPAR